jgi:hypothetical protein
MKRKDWTFTYTASKLAEAATAKTEKHKGKLTWWEEKKAETLKKVAESGIEVKDSVASSYSNTKGGFGPEIVIDRTLQRDLTECQEKIMEHHNLVEQYDGWVQVLSANPEARLELNQDDYLFFYGK